MRIMHRLGKARVITAAAALAAITAGSVFAAGHAGASATSPRPCATFYIAIPDRSPHPGTQPLLSYTFCGKGINPGRWSCVAPQGLVSGKALACKP